MISMNSKKQAPEAKKKTEWKIIRGISVIFPDGTMK